MKKFLATVILLTFSLTVLCSCVNPNDPDEYKIPEQNIEYTYFTLGNVIDNGKRAVFFNFESDYIVTKMEFAGNLMNSSGQVIHSFDSSTNLGNGKINPEVAISIDADIAKNVRSVSFSKLNAFTTEKIESAN